MSTVATSHGPWFERTFELGTPVTLQPGLVERLRGTPTRLEERVSRASPDHLARRAGASWSIAEHGGHLGDLEPLWLGRIEDLLANRERLRPADLENKATWAADHNTRPIDTILSEFRDLRANLVDRVAELGEGQLRCTALHPRLERPMSVVDLCFFVAEHDDHHLASITSILSAAV